MENKGSSRYAELLRLRRKRRNVFFSFLAVLLAAALVFTFIYFLKPKESNKPSDNSEPGSSQEEQYEIPSIFETPVREYGDPLGFVVLDGKMLTRIMYPEGEVSSLNKALEKFNNTTFDYYINEAAETTEQNPAELSIDYESYKYGERYASVKMYGNFLHPHLAHPTDIVKTFTADLRSGKLLDIDDLLSPSGREKLENLVADTAGVEKEFVDSNILDCWLITDNQLQIILPRGSYLPMSEGTKVLSFNYSELTDILKLEKEKPQSTPEKEEKPSNPAIHFEENIKFDKEKPMLALTFDDGPGKHTERLLDIFEKNGGKGTFFVVGNLVENRKQTLKRISQSGHEIGGHSWNHMQLTKLSPEEIAEQISFTSKKITQITGVTPRLIRPPYGSSNHAIEAVCKKQEIYLANWSVDTLDWKYRDADTVYNAVMKGAEDGAIILCHDIHKTTVDAMQRAIPNLIDEGYQLVTVSQLIEAKSGKCTPGKLYFGF